MTKYGMVIVGAGESGARAAVELRSQGWNGDITIIGEENWRPYERPPLSKYSLVATKEPEPKFILSEEQIINYDLNLITSCKVTKINRGVNQIELMDGRTISYERLLLTTGSYARKLPNEMVRNSNLLYLRSFSDSLSIRKRLQPKKHIVIIGGGFIGLEVASCAIEMGCEVTVIEKGERLLMRAVPEKIALLIEERHRSANVNFMFGVDIKHIERIQDNHIIVLQNNEILHCDTVVVGIGAIPETTLAVQSGLEVENGIKANGMLQTSDSNIFVAGDCCSFPHELFNNRRIRLEAWRNAQDQGIHVAKTMLGAQEKYSAVPWFWSDQYEQTLQIVGLPDSSQKVVERDKGKDGKIYFHLSTSGTLVAASAFGKTNLSKDIRISEMLIEKQVKLDREYLEDSNSKLKNLLKLSL